MLLFSLASFFSFSEPAFAAVTVLVDKPNGYVTAGQTVSIPTSISGLTWAQVDVIITTQSGNMTVGQSGVTLTKSPGYNSFTGTELSFYGSLADVETALEQQLTWTSPSTPASTLMKFKLTLREHRDGQVVNPDNGHTYRFIQSLSGVTWFDAKTAAEALSENGHSGYIVTITSASENTFVASKTGAQNIWIGAISNEAYLAGLNPSVTGNKSNCNYYWGTGSEAGTAISTGCSGSRAAVAGSYFAWATGEPNNYRGTPGEDCGVTNWSGVSGAWNDLPCTRLNPGYLVEFDTDNAGIELLDVVYENSDGTGTDTDLSNGGGGGIVPPGPPESPSATGGSGSAIVSWDAPTTGGAVVSYTVTAGPGGRTCTVNAPSTSCEVYGLTGGVQYTFSITATNSGGSSSASTPTEAVTPTAPPAPNAPTNVTAVGGDGRATVSWSAPVGGGAPASYMVVSQPDGLFCTVDAPATSCEITGLTNGSEYTFTVAASNGTGTATSDPSSGIVPNSYDFTQPLTVYFEPISAKLSEESKTDIAAYVNSGYFTSVSCVGSSQGSKLITWLANNRSKSACNYARTILRKMKTKVRVVTTGTLSASSRSVVLTFGPQLTR